MFVYYVENIVNYAWKESKMAIVFCTAADMIFTYSIQFLTLQAKGTIQEPTTESQKVIKDFCIWNILWSQILNVWE